MPVEPSAAPSPPPASAAQATAAGTIVLFADGTGNSSAKLFKTNVWRMYEAVDLGPNRKGDPVQVAYYDNGVGTQAIRLFAVIAGIFGFGLKANVLRLYRFACRNARPGCKIYCFGFSRGAFTIRLVAALIAEKGIVEYDSQGELNARSLDAFRDFMRRNNPNIAGFVGDIGRAVRDVLVKAKRALIGPHLEPGDRLRPSEIAFIGVWDTVAAYGGPISEITRGIDDYIWPLTMSDSCLHENVRVARHALSLDDERDAFQPVLWDEVDWEGKALAEYDKRTGHAPLGDDKRRRIGEGRKPDAALAALRGRLKQVWFAGMHSDVGGGYPDESLSYVSLCWMMDEAEKAGLRLLPRFKSRARQMSNSLGPIHNSRGGLGVYYRPQPRKIAAFLHKDSGMDLEGQTLSLRDPVLGEEPKPPHGVLLGCQVHQSVIARLVEGTDDYAPATFPPRIEIEPYSHGILRMGGNPIVDPALVEALEHRNDDWYARQERIWDFVLWRRLAYFAAVAATILFVAMPIWVDAFPEPDLTDNREVMERLTGWSRYAAPSWLMPWIRAFEVNPFWFFGLLILAFAFSAAGGILQGIARTRSRQLWNERIANRRFTLDGPSRLTRARTSEGYQRSLQLLKWYLLPFIAAPTMVVGPVAGPGAGHPGLLVARRARLVHPDRAAGAARRHRPRPDVRAFGARPVQHPAAARAARPPLRADLQRARAVEGRQLEGQPRRGGFVAIRHLAVARHSVPPGRRRPLSPAAVRDPPGQHRAPAAAQDGDRDAAPARRR
ncbi:MAG TPA: DUF2235 domain-containing protein [Novosphingobium sp.]|nr:DUF2235 domain-containing protein [Novosphingobium sp.]